MGLSLSEKEYELLLDAIKDHAIFMMDTNGNIISWNDGAKRLKGFHEEEVMGKHFRLLFRQDDKEMGRPEMEMEKALDTGRYEEEWWRIRKDGSQFWARTILQPVFDDDKKHIGFAKITEDITDQKRINELNDFLIKEVAGGGFAIFLLDKAGKVAKWSKAAESIIGFTEEEVTGKTLFFLDRNKEGEDSEQEVEQALSKALRGRHEEEGWKVKKDGSHFWANYIITPLHNEDGYVVLIRDLTDKRALQQELKSNTNLAASNKQLTHFASITSHELKEPIRKISVFCDMLKADSPHQEILLDKIILACKRASNLLNDILDLSLISYDKPNAKQDLNLILQSVLESLDEQIKEKKAVIKCNKLPDVRVIAGQMEQMMQNLISNALKFCCINNETPVVNIEGVIVAKESLEAGLLNIMLHSDQYLQIKVQDNGIGFDQKYDSHIFDLFKRLHGSSQYEGTGVGLSICKRVAENHGGNIAAFSEPGKGTLFIITLPFYDK